MWASSNLFLGCSIVEFWPGDLPMPDSEPDVAVSGEVIFVLLSVEPPTIWILEVVSRITCS